jgi:hypothetical protein
MMHATMLMQAMGDGGVHDIIWSHKEISTYVGCKTPLRVKGVLVINGVFHNVRCKVYTIIDRKPCLLVSKWDILMKHQSRRKAKKDLLKFNIKKGEWYNIKSCKHKQNQNLFSTRVPI